MYNSLTNKQWLMLRWYFEDYLPGISFSDEQLKFFENALKQISEDTDTNYVTVFAGRPGIGKSTFVRTLILTLCMAFNTGAIVITDLIDRLKGYTFSDSNIYYLFDIIDDGEGLTIREQLERRIGIIYSNPDESVQEQLVRNNNKQIILLTTQRYFQMNQHSREILFSYTHDGKKYPRNLVFMDEKPYFVQQKTIDFSSMTSIYGALLKGLTDQTEDKAWILDQYQQTKDYLIDLMLKTEQSISNDSVRMFLRPEKKTISDDDKRFFGIIEKNQTNITRVYAKAFEELRLIQRILVEGAIFINSKVKSAEKTYSSAFFLPQDNRDAFYLGGDRKFFVFDGTADIDPDYRLDYVKVFPYKAYDIPLNLKITSVNVPTSRRTLGKKSESSEEITSAIRQFIKEKHGKTYDVLAVVYKRLVGRFKKYGFENAGYFGGLKGLNDYRNLHAMAHVGLNRWRTQDYLLPWLAINNELYQDISKMDEKGSKEYLDQIWKGTSDISVLIDKYIAAHMVSDFEQNIFRLSIRNFSSTEPVNVWLFHYYEKNPVNTIAQNLIEEHFGQYAGVTFEHIDHLQELKDSRGKKLAEKHDTHAWRICKYLDEQAPVGKLFKVRDILRNTGLSDKQYQKAKAQNEWLAEKLARIGTDIKGLLYIRPP